MSHVTSLLILCDYQEREVEDALKRLGFRCAEPSESGGNKAMQAHVWAAAWNYLNLEPSPDDLRHPVYTMGERGLRDSLAVLPWGTDGQVYYFINHEHEDGWKVWELP